MDVTEQSNVTATDGKLQAATQRFFISQFPVLRLGRSLHMLSTSFYLAYSNNTDQYQRFIAELQEDIEFTNTSLAGGSAVPSNLSVQGSGNGSWLPLKELRLKLALNPHMVIGDLGLVPVLLAVWQQFLALEYN